MIKFKFCFGTQDRFSILSLQPSHHSRLMVRLINAENLQAVLKSLHVNGGPSCKIYLGLKTKVEMMSYGFKMSRR